MKLKGKIALVTGSTRGIGRGCALHLARLGADVVISGRDLHLAKFGEQLTAETVMDEIRALGRRSLGITCDVANKKEVDAMFERILDEFGRIDILINNAGGLQENPETSYASSVPEEDLRREVDRNLTSCIFCCQAASIPMKKQKSGRIVNLSSIAGLRAVGTGGFYASYGVAKAGVIYYTMYLADELAPFGINVNCIAPGLIRTGRLMQRTFDTEPGKLTSYEQSVPLRRLGTVEDCAKAVEFLVTDLSDYITGQCIRVDGGLSLF